MQTDFYYKIKLSDKQDNWIYRDDYSRVIRFDSKEKVIEEIKKLFSEDRKLTSASIIEVSEVLLDEYIITD